MNPDTLRAWQPVVRDFIIVLVATFILLHETLVNDEPNAYLVGAGLALLGAPAALRVDAFRRQTNGDDDEKWSHLP